MIPIALTIAGSDPSGGAGVQADLKTFSALGAYGASVITALTAQSTTCVRGILDVPPAFVEQQLEVLREDLRIAAVKIGMLSQPGVIDVVAGWLGRIPGVPVVADPVMVSKSGARLLQPQAVARLRDGLLPLCTVVTPNWPEAAVLLGVPEAQVAADPEAACRALLGLGLRAVVLKGGHGRGAHSEDLLLSDAGLARFSAPRVPTQNTHGTGCTFSAAIAAGLAHGRPLRDAVAEAKAFIAGAIAAADQLAVGQGHGPVHHFHRLWR